MTDYTITTNFGAKDSLPSGNAAKVIKGSEFTTEFTNIATAVNSKADKDGATFTGNITFDTNTLFVDASTNRVGIGIASPTQKLQVDGNIRIGDTAIGVDDDEDYNITTGGQLTIHANDSGANVDYIGLNLSCGNSSGSQAAYSRITCFVNNDEKMRIDSSGNVLVGTTDATPYSKTTGSGICWGGGTNRPNSIARESSATCLILNKTGTQAGTSGIQDFRYDGTSIGAIGISSTAVTYTTGSDERLKENITDSADAGSKVDAIQIRQFDWKSDGSHQDYGVIAQELVTVAPEAVHQPVDEEDMMGVDYSKLVPMLVKEVQALRSRVAQLEESE